MAADEAGALQRPHQGSADVEIHTAQTATIKLRGECDISTAPQVADALARTRHANTIVDLSDCEFIDSTIVGVLISAQRDADARRGQLAVVLPPTANAVVNRVFDMLRLRDVFCVHASAEATQTSPR